MATGNVYYMANSELSALPELPYLIVTIFLAFAFIPL